jgi:hypothetical protein
MMTRGHAACGVFIAILIVTTLIPQIIECNRRHLKGFMSESIANYN